MCENNNNSCIYRDGFEVYWEEENQEQTPDSAKNVPADDSNPEIEANIGARRDSIHEQLEHPLNGIYGCP